MPRKLAWHLFLLTGCKKSFSFWTFLAKKSGFCDLQLLDKVYFSRVKITVNA